MLADALSRAVQISDSNNKTEIDQKEIDAITDQVLKEIPSADSRKEEIKNRQLDDDECQLVRQLCQIGWPESLKATPKLAQPYWSFKEQITENHTSNESKS